MSLSCLTTCVDLNCDWFIPNLLFKRVVIDWLFLDNFGSRNDDNKSSQGVSKAKKSE